MCYRNRYYRHLINILILTKYKVTFSQVIQPHPKLRQCFPCVLQTVSNEMSTDEETEFPEEKDSYMCAVCLDVYFNPYMCYPCHHIFCEPCLRTLAKDNPASTPCPLCRTIISRVFLQTGNVLFHYHSQVMFSDYLLALSQKA